MKYKTIYTDEECSTLGCRTKARCSHPYHKDKKFCEWHLYTYLANQKQKYYEIKNPIPNLSKEDLKIWRLIQDRELSFSEKLAKLNNEPKHEILTVKNYL